MKKEIEGPLQAKESHWKHYQYNEEHVVPYIKGLILEGCGQNMICARLNEMGIRTSTGRLFLQPNIHRLMKLHGLYTRYSHSNPASPNYVPEEKREAIR